MKFGSQDDWALIQNIKAKKDQDAIEREKKLSETNRRIYKKQLDSQLFLQELQREEQSKQKILESAQLAAQIKQYELEEKQRKDQTLKKQLELAEMLETHKGIQKVNKEMQKARSAQEDLQYLSFIQEKAELEERQKRERKELEFKRQQDIKNMAKLQEEFKKREREKEKTLENKLMIERKLVDSKREQEHQDFFKMLSLKQQKITHHFNENILSKNQEKEMLIDQWINKRMDEMQRKQNIEAKEAAKKKQQIIMMNQDLMRKHIEAKNDEKRNLLMEKQRMLDEVSRKNEELKRIEAEAKANEKEKKKEYMQVLKLQNQAGSELRTSPNGLNDIEKKINRDLFEEGNNMRFQLQATNIIQSPRSQLAFNNKVVGSPKNSYKSL